VADEKGMIYNPVLQRWEGNEHALTKFENPSTSTLPLQPTYHDEGRGLHLRTNSIPLNLPSQASHNLIAAAPPTMRPQESFASAAAAATLALTPRDHNVNAVPARQASPPRPALISQINNVRGVVVERGMVFDPQRMTWLKLDSRALQQVGAAPLHALGAASRGTGSVVSISVEEEEDPFAGMENLVDERDAKVAVGSGAAFSVASPTLSNKENAEAVRIEDPNWVVGEEFDLGPAFVRRQRAEEGEWRRKVERWMGERGGGETWRWEIRRVAERVDMRV
jgi:hypothetical protein